jgi:hypothetical protein
LHVLFPERSTRWPSHELYLGSGTDALEAEAAREATKVRRESRRRRIAARIARMDGVERPLKEFCAFVDHLVLQTMEGSGYHRYKRGDWRRRRMHPFLPRPTDQKPQLKSLLGVLLARVKEGDTTAVPAIREAIDTALNYAPATDLAKLSRSDPATAAELALLDWVAGKDAVKRELIRRRLTQLREDLAGPLPPTALELMMIERVALTWLEVNTWDAKIGRYDAFAVHKGCESYVNLQERRRTAAHRRFNLAVKTLATVRRLLSRSSSENI